MNHECKHEDRISKISEDTSLIKQALCGGNGQVGLNQRIENIEKMLLPLTYVCMVVGVGLGILKDWFINHGNR